jgi:glycosyltransferase involved in cell wall biosynthesis
VDGFKPKIVVAQPGARRHYAVPALLHQAGMLAHFFTDAYVGRGSAWQKLPRLAELLPAGYRPAGLQRLLGRREDGLPPEKVTAFNLFGAAYAWAQRRAKNGEALERVYRQYGRRFAEMVRRHSLCQGQGLYTFPSTALPLFQQVSHQGMKLFLDQFSAPRKIMSHLIKEEYERWPGWEKPNSWAASSTASLESEKQECHLADAIFCPSKFVAQGLESLNIPSDKIFLVPYGVDRGRFSCERPPWNGHRPLRLLFVGEVNLLKGVPYLYQALERLGATEVTARLVGAVALQEPYRGLLARRSELTGLVPRTEIRWHYEWADLLIFPTICDSFGIVQVEALSAGLPVITTPNAGSVVRDGVDGFIVPIRDAEALAEKIDLLAHNAELLGWMSQNAKERSQEFSWEKYGERLVGTLKDILSSNQADGT